VKISTQTIRHITVDNTGVQNIPTADRTAVGTAALDLFVLKLSERAVVREFGLFVIEADVVKHVSFKQTF
jgi:hypothetical protein